MTAKRLAQLSRLPRELVLNAELPSCYPPGPARQNAKLRAEEHDCLIRAEISALTAYIDSAPDSLTRQVLRLRFERGKSWVGVAMAVGGNNTPDGVRKICQRYLATH